MTCLLNLWLSMALLMSSACSRVLPSRAQLFSTSVAMRSMSPKVEPSSWPTYRFAETFEFRTVASLFFSNSSICGPVGRSNLTTSSKRRHRAGIERLFEVRSSEQKRPSVKVVQHLQEGIHDSLDLAVFGGVVSRPADCIELIEQDYPGFFMDVLEHLPYVGGRFTEQRGNDGVEAHVHQRQTQSQLR